jgi:hypothetical protein
MSVYALSDLHGCLDIYKSVKALLNPEDRVYFLGDAGDRGPQSWETIKAIARDPQFIYLKGNHEDMLVAAAEEYFKNDEYIGSNYRCLASNGGGPTFDGLMNDEMPREWVKYLKGLPTFEIYINATGETVDLSHAGFTPWLSSDGNDIEIPGDQDLIWDRDHYLDTPEIDEIDPKVIIVHGHTPIPFLLDDLNIPEDGYDEGAFWYDNHRKVCIDCGAVWTGEAVLLNLDTWEETIIHG